jgi:hypothetical protein
VEQLLSMVQAGAPHGSIDSPDETTRCGHSSLCCTTTPAMGGERHGEAYDGELGSDALKQREDLDYEILVVIQ